MSKILFIFSITFLSFNVNAQTALSHEIFYFEATGFGNVGYGGGGHVGLGNNFYLLEERKNNPVISLHWLSLGFTHQLGGTGFYVGTPQIGGGYRFRITNNVSVDTKLFFGMFMISDDILAPDWDYNLFLRPQIKFNLGRFNIGVDYSPSKVFREEGVQLEGIHHYVGVNMGFSFDSFGRGFSLW